MTLPGAMHVSVHLCGAQCHSLAVSSQVSLLLCCLCLVQEPRFKRKFALAQTPSPTGSTQTHPHASLHHSQPHQPLGASCRPHTALARSSESSLGKGGGRPGALPRSLWQHVMRWSVCPPETSLFLLTCSIKVSFDSLLSFAATLPSGLCWLCL